jgi:hypothetical protein
VSAQAAGTSWASWYGDVVPPRIRGRYFAMRSRVVHAATCGALLGAGVLLQSLEPGAAGEVAAGAGGIGFAVIFGTAAVARSVSAVLLALAPEPAFAGVPSAREAIDTLRGPSASPLRRMLVTAGVLQLVVYVGSPYFNPHMLEGLRLSYIEYTIAGVIVVLAKVVTLPRWGHAIDRFGARSVYLLAITTVAVVPLPWLWANGIAWVIVAEVLSGFAWAGHELAQFTLLLESADARMRPHLFAALATCNGAAQLAGGLIGGAILAVAGGSFYIVCVATLVGRCAVIAVAPALISGDVGQPREGRRRLLLRMVGIRVSGGLSHRPIDMDDDVRID